MSWSGSGVGSKIFRPYVADILANTTAIDLDGTDTINVALYNDTTTPNQDVTSALSAYNAATSQWVVANEVTSSTTGWPAGGNPLVSPVVNSSTAGVVFFDATDTSSTTSTATIANAVGCLVYDNTIATPVAKQGICFNYFGGANSVTNGTFTVVWSANGVMRFTL